MKNVITALLLFFFSVLLPPPSHASGDYENRLREAELAGDRAGAEKICKEWYASGQYSSGLLNWNFNALMSVEQNALLFTQQESDTYPAMLLQYALEIRPDISVVSFQLLENQKYREILIDRENLFWIARDCSVNDFIAKILDPQLTKTVSRKPVYFGSMTNKNLLQADKGKLYLTGLALKFSTQPFDNVATLRYNFENRFRTDYLDFQFETESDPATVARVNLNYIPALLLLHRHYAAAGEAEKAKRLQNLTLRIARAGNREAEVSAFFTRDQPSGITVTAITPKGLLKGMKKVGDKLYAAETELTNAQYELFLEDLLKNKEFDLLAKCRTAKTDWVSLLPEELRNVPDKLLFEHGHPDGPNFPVQNIPYEAAQQYCAWITNVYNASTEKKPYSKVVFRLPTEAEWMTAARGGKSDVPYPWGGFFVRNSKGCYLGNYNSTEPCGDCPDQVSRLAASTAEGGAALPMSVPLNPANATKTNAAKPGIISSNDGGFFPVAANSYFPNNFGLYAVSGNVAEMISEPGKTKGGSWQDIYYYGQIPTVKTVAGPSPAVGFRVFMEVIEE